MCGRFSVTVDPATLADELGAVDETVSGPAPAPVVPDYNVPPTRIISTVVLRHPRETAEALADGVIPDTGEPTPRVRAMRWGLVPPWAKAIGDGPLLFNARGETAASKPAFRAAARRRRCLVPIDGWYEWVPEPGSRRKQPFYMSRRDGRRLFLAGLWEAWSDPAGAEDAPPVLSCAIVTTEAVGEHRRIHDRMPRIIAMEDWARWLDPDLPAPGDLLAPIDVGSAAEIAIRPVGALVGDVRNNGPALIEDVSGAAEALF